MLSEKKTGHRGHHGYSHRDGTSVGGCLQPHLGKHDRIAADEMVHGIVKAAARHQGKNANNQETGSGSLHEPGKALCQDSGYNGGDQVAGYLIVNALQQQIDRPGRCTIETAKQDKKGLFYLKDQAKGATG